MRRHPEKSPFDDKWRRETFAALATHQYGALIAFFLADCHDALPGTLYGKGLLKIATQIVCART